MPGLPAVQIDPELVLLLFLPPLLFAAAWFTSWRDFAANRRPIALLAIGLVVVTTTAVAWIAHAVIPGMSWPVAFVLGAIVSPPDAVAATAVTQRLKVPRRIVTILEGESLVNDATGLVAYRFALAAVATGSFSLTHAAGRFAVVAAGGVAGRPRRRLAGRADPPPHGGLPARNRHHPADAVRGLHPGRAPRASRACWRRSRRAATSAGAIPQLLSALTRFRGQGVWSVLLLLFNGLVFILIGLQLASIRALTTGIAWRSLIALLGGGQRRGDRGAADLRADRDLPAAPAQPPSCAHAIPTRPGRPSR